MSRPRNAQRALEDALDKLAEMSERGMLPPVLEPLLSLAPPRGMRSRIELDRNGGRVQFVPARSRSKVTASDDPLADLLLVLDEAEQSPTLEFVALKFLRDRLLPQTRYGWAQSPQSCQCTIAEAIDRGILVTSKKPNPRNPEFPVTAVHIDRDHPHVARLLSKSAPARDDVQATEAFESSAQ